MFLRGLWRATAIIKTNSVPTAANHVAPPLCRLAEAALMRLRTVRLQRLLFIEIHRNGVCGQCATAGEEDASGTAIGTELSAWIVDLVSGEMVNAADFGCAVAPAATAPPERAMGRRCRRHGAGDGRVCRAGSRSCGGDPARADRRHCTELRPENGQRGAQCGGDRAAHLVAGTRRRLRPAGARG